MALLFANKFEKDGHLKEESKEQEGQNTPLYFINLMVKILMRKPENFDKAAKYIAENKGSFDIWLDYKKIELNIML